MVSNQRGIKVINITKNQARAIVFLKESNRNLHYCQYMAGKLDLSYQYCQLMLQKMFIKGWIYRDKSPVKGNIRVYYFIKQQDVVKEAMGVVNKKW